MKFIYEIIKAVDLVGKLPAFDYLIADSFSHMLAKLFKAVNIPVVKLLIITYLL